MRTSRILPFAFFTLLGCSEPAGIVRVHFELHPPAVIDFGGLTPPPVDPLVVSRADGAVDALPGDEELEVEFSGLPPSPTSPHMMYRLWLSPSPSGGAWVYAAEVGPNALGAASLHLEQANIALPFEALRSAVLTLDAHEAVGPSHTVILAGAARPDSPATVPGADAGGGGGHNH